MVDFKMAVEGPTEPVDAFLKGGRYTPSSEQINRISELLTSITRLSMFSEERMNKFELKLKELQDEFIYGTAPTTEE
jgi:hypothetical protein